MSLEQFRVPMQAAGKVIDAAYTAYKMDGDESKGEKDMRKAAGLGACHCCDYFLLDDESVILIEETQLSKTVAQIKEKYGYLGEKDLKDIINNKITEEVQLKVYGAMLVMSRIMEKCDGAKELMQGKKTKFWLVASRADAPTEAKLSDEDDRALFLDNRDSDLKDRLSGSIGGTLLVKVSILSVNALESWLARHAPAP